MGHRDVKRVPLDFDWPLNKVWEGYILPESLREERCETCDGSGASPEARHLTDRWYGKVPFDPAETGSTPFTPDTPEVRAFAERNVAHAPDYYGTGEAAIEREARRLVSFWNEAWCHHLSQDDVAVLVEEGRLLDFTHTFVRGEGWKPIEPVPTVTAEAVNRWSLVGFGHDSINCWVVVRAACKRLGVPEECADCNGHGYTERYPGQRAEADAWTPVEPPAGEGWQLWETASEGSPVSPVFETPDALATWCEGNATVFARMTATRAEWYQMITGETLDVDSLLVASPTDGMTFLGRASKAQS